MPDRAASRTVLAMLLLVLAIAGIGAVGPHVGLHAPSRAAGLTIAAVLEVFLAGLLVALRTGKTPPSGPARRLHAMLTGALVTALLAVPAVAALASLRPSRTAVHVRPPRARAGFREHVAKAAHGHGLDIGLRPLLAALLLAALLVVLVVAWRRRRHAWLLARQADPFADDEDDDAPAELARAVGSGQRALHDLDDARTAIIRCYVAMEDSLAQAGAQREASETPDELLARARSTGLVGPGPARRLTALFYEARFSTHPMPTSRRDEASAALASLAADLPEPSATESAP